MTYKGIIKKSRTLDLSMLNQMVDVVAAGVLMYEPEQLGITIPVYLAIRVGLNLLQVYLRYKTTGPVGEK